MRLPNFLIVGGQKCGTTTLHDLLSSHQEISMSVRKEVNYFTSERKYRKGLKFYAQHWDIQEGESLIGEASPGYMVYPGVAERIHKDLGPIKIIMILRDPVKRAISQYWDNRRKLNESETFEQVMGKYLTSNYDPQSKGYFSRGAYMNYIEKYWSLFGKENVYLLTLENLIADKDASLNGLLRFLGANEGSLSVEKASNSSMIWNNAIYKFFLNNPRYIPMLPIRGKRLLYFGKKVKYNYAQPSEEIIASLKDFYHPWNERLVRKTGLDISNWFSYS
ncbi:MAG: sulfotransferase [Cyanobacteria bacterium J06600_6]